MIQVDEQIFQMGRKKKHQPGINRPAKYINSIFWWFYLDISLCCVKKTCAVSVTLGSIHPPRNVFTQEMCSSQTAEMFMIKNPDIPAIYVPCWRS